MLGEIEWVLKECHMQIRTTGAYQVDFDLVERFMKLTVCFGDDLVHGALSHDHGPGIALCILSKDFTNLDELR